MPRGREPVTPATAAVMTAVGALVVIVALIVTVTWVVVFAILVHAGRAQRRADVSAGRCGTNPICTRREDRP
jgi:flagellar biogenesis protein FliO